MPKYSTHDHYVDEESGVLRNKLLIADESVLEKIEADYAAARSFELAKEPLLEPFTPRTLQKIHKHLFGDLYEWAGEFRTIDISKGSTRFANFLHIESELIKLFDALRQEKELSGLNAEAFSARAAYYMGELNAIHPFREGNGRTQRELLSQLAYRNGYTIHWNAIGSQDILDAFIATFHRDYEPLTKLIQANLKHKNSD